MASRRKKLVWRYRGAELPGFKPILRQYEAAQLAGKWRIFNKYTRKAMSDLEFDRQDDAIKALKNLKAMMRNVALDSTEKAAIEQQGKQEYKKNQRKKQRRETFKKIKKKRKYKGKLPPVRKFNEPLEQYNKRLKLSRGSSSKNPIFI